jgi:16S rRNA (cytosine967-C5)-methyltransferase
MEYVLRQVSVLVKARRDSFKSPKPDAVRVLVFDVLTEVNHRDGYSNLLLPSALAASALDARDKGFATELLYGAIRMQGRHDYILGQVFDRPIAELDTGIVDICRLGVHQLFEMRVATHAAVSATVELARKAIGESKASYVNAILRKVSAQDLSYWLAPAQEITDDISRLSIIHSHPEWIVSAYFDLLKNIERVEAELIANNTPAQPTLVSWPGLSTQEDLIALGGVATPFSPYGAKVDSPPASIELIRHRQAGVQDEGSQLVAHIFSLAAHGSERILDLCAGPGGKAALLSSIARESGRLFIANEVSEARAALVKKVVKGAQVWVGDGRKVAEHGESFDAVLVDAPCTGLGALRRRPEVRWRRTLQGLRELTELQSELAEGALSVLNPGGIFGYATCSPHYAETSAQVKAILKKHPELEQVDVTSYLPENLHGATRDGALSLWASVHNTDSMYLALFRKRMD